MALHDLPRKATAVVCAFNLIALVCLLYALLSPVYFYSNVSSSLAAIRHAWRRSEGARITAAEVARIREAFEARRALEPVELIRRVKEIQEESNKAALSDPKLPSARRKYAAELADRLKHLKGANAKKNQQAIEEWRQKKLESLRKKVEIHDNNDKTKTAIVQDKSFGV